MHIKHLIHGSAFPDWHILQRTVLDKKTLAKILPIKSVVIYSKFKD